MKISYFVLLICFVLFFNNSNAQVSGCTDPLANNYNAAATSNDGSCMYNVISVAPTASFNLSANIPETSGLIKWDNRIWTHNDNTDINLYSLDTANGNTNGAYLISGAENIDWEEISQDDNYVYIGDFGNNANGNRTDLKILRISKNSILSGSPVTEIIHFSYSDQTNFLPAGSNNTDFDCEAFVVSTDSIYLFTKQWISNNTSVYSLAKTPGTYTAHFKSTYTVQGLITGATYMETKNLIVLSGYSNALQPFAYLLYDFNGSDFFGGNKRKIGISLPFHQLEGIATANGLKYYISNEYFALPPAIVIPQKMHTLDLSPYLSGYLNSFYNSVEFTAKKEITVFPNPAYDFITIKADENSFPCKL